MKLPSLKAATRIKIQQNDCITAYFQNRLIPWVSIIWISEPVWNILKAQYLLKYTLFVDLKPIALPRKYSSLSLDHKAFHCLKLAFCFVRSTEEYSEIHFLWYWFVFPLPFDLGRYIKTVPLLFEPRLLEESDKILTIL